MSTVEEIVTAFHESGHIIAYCRQNVGHLIDNATLSPPLVRVRGGERSVLSAATCCLCGPVAESIYAGRPLAAILAGVGANCCAATPVATACHPRCPPRRAY
jgi:hypothetical protein